MENLFRSRRLIYRAVEPADEAFFHTIQSDPVAYTNSDTNLARPMSRAESARHHKFVSTEALLGVVIALPGGSAIATNPNAETSSASNTSSISAAPVDIGCIFLTAPGAPQLLKSHHRHAEIGIDIISPYQGQGYGSEAIEWVLNYGFRMAGLHRIGIECFSFNEGAMRLYERLGFVEEGRKREALWFNGGWWDYLSFGMLEGEWRERESKKVRSAER